MVREQISDPCDGRLPVRNPRVLEALRAVPRHLFVPPALLESAHEDRALPIGLGQTISQPYIVAVMTELLEPSAGDRMLEVGTGSGYQAAVLAALIRDVFSVERVPALARNAGELLKRLGATQVQVRLGDGFEGWPEEAPYDGILLSAAPDQVPERLLAQLRPGGRLVAPVGPAGSVQQLTVWRRMEKGAWERREVMSVVFVPMVADLAEDKIRD